MTSTSSTMRITLTTTTTTTTHHHRHPGNRVPRLPRATTSVVVVGNPSNQTCHGANVSYEAALRVEWKGREGGWERQGGERRERKEGAGNVLKRALLKSGLTLDCPSFLPLLVVESCAAAVAAAAAASNRSSRAAPRRRRAIIVVPVFLGTPPPPPPPPFFIARVSRE